MAGKVLLEERYAIEAALGAGGLGAVFRAHDRELGREVAVKLLRDRTHAARRESLRLVREANAMARISHPNVVQVFDVGRYEGLAVDDLGLPDVTMHGLFVVMELVRGRDLSRWLETRPSREAILRVFVQAARGLAAAHAQGIVHRDFKPANVLLTEDELAKVTDFGLAAACGPTDADTPVSTRDLDAPPRSEEPEVSDDAWLIGSLTTTGLAMGTPAYMAPEQHRGGEVDASADQYAFCVALAEAVFGQRPARGRTLEELLRSKLEVRLPSGGDVPRWLRAVLERGLDPEPSRRFASMSELADALMPRSPWRRRAPMLAIGTTLVVASLFGAWPSHPTSNEVREPAMVAAVQARSGGWGHDEESVLDPSARTFDEGHHDARLRARFEAIMAELRTGMIHEERERIPLIRELREVAGKVGDPALIVEAELFHASGLRAAGDMVSARSTAEAAYHFAQEAGEHTVAARAAGMRMGLEEAGNDAWEHWARLAEVQVGLCGGDPQTEWGLAQERGLLALNSQNYEDAAHYFTRVVEVGNELHGPEHPGMIGALSLLATAQIGLDEPGPAEAALRRALGIAERTMPGDLGLIVQTRTDLARALAAQNDLLQAVHELEESLALLLSVEDPDEHATWSIGNVHWQLANYMQDLGRHTDALDHFRQVIPRLDPTFPYNGLVLHRQMADSQLALEQRPEAVASLRAALTYVDPDAPEWEERVEARKLLQSLESGA